jgi:formylglycine-generating enzyme required for sulfatase activity
VTVSAIRRALFAALLLLAVAGVALLAWHHARPPQLCAAGMVLLGPRCCGAGQRLEQGACRGAPTRCAADMQRRDDGCVAQQRTITIAGGHLKLGPIDWEAERMVRPYEAQVAAFGIDRVEVTEEQYQRCVQAKACEPLALSDEPGRPMVNVSVQQARRHCRFRGGDLPTRDQHAFAMMGADGHRYPWGNTGAVCRRAAFGLKQGPCAEGGGPQLAGNHPDGASPEGVLDLAGNVAEWTLPIEAGASGFEARGGSWRDAEAARLRGWNGVRSTDGAGADDVGFRCAYPSGAAKR